MSVQVFLQGKLLGIEHFLLAPAADGAAAGEALLAGRSRWVSLIMELIPRAMLAELGLANILLGSSGGGGFLLVLPQESIPAAEAFLDRAARQMSSLSGGRVRLIWSSTENLGDWTTVRRRLLDEMWRRQNTSPEALEPDAFAPRNVEAASSPSVDFDDYFLSIAAESHDSNRLGWEPANPGMVLFGKGKHEWHAGDPPEGIPWARHAAPADDGTRASTALLGARAEGRPAWGVLRADVDGFGIRLRRANTIEEHLWLSVMFKQFFAGELEVVCSLPEFWRKVTILYSGGDDFAAYGSWDALIALAREMERLFRRLTDEQMKEVPGPEGKTISMALAVAPAVDTPFAFVYEEAGRQLEASKSADRDRFWLFGTSIEWRQMPHSADLKDMMLRMVRDFRCPPQFLEELGGFYRDKAHDVRQQGPRHDRPWRYHRRAGAVLGAQRGRDLERMRTALITEVIGRSPTQVRLRPAGRVAVAWARFLLTKA